MAFHRIEFTWFHYSQTVLAFCCTCPQLTLDGCYPLCYSVLSGLSSSNTRSDKTTYLILQNYVKYCYKKTHSKFEWENCYEKEKVLLDISLTTFQRYIIFYKKNIFFSFFYENISFTFSKNDLSNFEGFGLK